MKIVGPVRSGLLIFPFSQYRVEVTASSSLKSGLALGLGLGRKLYFAVCLGLYPTIVGGAFGGIGGLLMGGGDVCMDCPLRL